MQQKQRKPSRSRAIVSKRNHAMSTKAEPARPIWQKRAAANVRMTQRSAVAWPNTGMPRCLIGDNGLTWGRHLDDLMKDFGIAIQSVPPRRPECKSRLEKDHRKLG